MVRKKQQIQTIAELEAEREEYLTNLPAELLKVMAECTPLYIAYTVYNNKVEFDFPIEDWYSIDVYTDRTNSQQYQLTELKETIQKVKEYIDTKKRKEKVYQELLTKLTPEELEVIREKGGDQF